MKLACDESGREAIQPCLVQAEPMQEKAAQDQAFMRNTEHPLFKEKRYVT